jgi:hydroxymethylglutaryl-CoA lyase
MIGHLVALGFTHLEIASFVSPKVIPAMADSEALVRQAIRVENVRYRAFVPNMKGFERAVSSGIHEVGVAIAASNTFNLKNIRCDIDQGIAAAALVAAAAKDRGIEFGACIATAVYCPYEGYIEPDRVVRLARRFVEMGCDSIYLGETIGRARPEETYRLLKILKEHVPVASLGAHFHDTWGQGIANYSVCLEEGISSFDTSLGGLGGCPFAPGAAGNVATEDLLYLLQSKRFECDLRLSEVAELNRKFCLQNELPYVTKAGNACQQVES